MDNINFIYLERATKALDRCINDAATGSVARALCNAKEAVLSEVETMYNVQPVKHGEWDFQGYQLFKCTNCKEIFTQNQLEAMQNYIDQEEFTFPHFCPNCGADMRGEQNDD